MSTLSLAAFGETDRHVRNLEKAVVHLETIHGGKLSMEVLIVPTIAAPLSNRTHYEALKLSYLQGIELVNPMSKDEHFEIAMLIGADYYWDIVENDILRGMGPTAVKSKLGYLLSGPMPTIEESTVPATTLNVLVQHKKEEAELELFWKLESTGVTPDESTKKGQTLLRDIRVNSITSRQSLYNKITM